MGTWITVCDTCKPEGLSNDSTETAGERLAALVEASATAEPSVNVRRFSCLMGCARACNVTIQAPGKVGYSLSQFLPTETDAQAIVSYAALHSQSETGRVPYREWPEGVKGHFASRHPALPDS